jgi:hypothetical protein
MTPRRLGSVLPALLLLAGAPDIVGTARAVRAAQDAPAAPAPPVVEPTRWEREAAAAAPLVESALARAFLSAAAHLPPGEPRTVYLDRPTRRYVSASAAALLSESERGALRLVNLSAEEYYTSRYGTPLAYVRPLELVGRRGLEDVRGRRILDFGYGTVGHLRLLASLGAEVRGVDVDSFLTALYCEPHDQGAVAGVEGKPGGSVRLIDGRWPGEEAIRTAVGEGCDLFISKNTLKRGYIHPEGEADPRMLVHLGVDDETYVRALFRVLKPGGLAMIYNLSPAPAPPGEPYMPWADGRCPFDRALLESVGFEVLRYDEDDSPAARALGRAFGWDKREDAMDLEEDLFAHYTLLRRPAR